MLIMAALAFSNRRISQDKSTMSLTSSQMKEFSGLMVLASAVNTVSYSPRFSLIKIAGLSKKLAISVGMGNALIAVFMKHLALERRARRRSRFRIAPPY